MSSRKVNDLIKLYALDGSSRGFLTHAYNIKHDRVLNDYNILTFSLPSFVDIQAEQEIIYKNTRFIITQIVQTRDENGHKVTDIDATSAFIDLSNKIVKKVEFIAVSLATGLNKILNGSNWTVGNIPIDSLQYSMSEENQSVLWLVREFARVAGYEVDFDTINRKVNFVAAIGEESNLTFRYRKNIKEIKKTAIMPTATVIYPYGRGGLTIAAVNGGINYLEDYSWYVSMGMTLTEAKKKYRKEYIWEDERFIYSGTLLRAAQEKLAELSRPQISYETNVIDINAEKIDVGDYCYVIDDELKVRLKVRVVRLEQYPEKPWDNQIELNYLLPGLINDSDSNAGDSSSNEESMVMVKNESALTITQNLSRILSLAISTYSSTNLQCAFYLIGQATSTSVLNIFFKLKEEIIGPNIKQTVNGWETIGIPFVLSQVQDGTYYLDVYAQTDVGTVSVDKNAIELSLKGANMLGGLSSELPSADVIEEVNISSVEEIKIIESVLTSKQIPIKSVLTENVDLSNRINVTENMNISFNEVNS